MKNKIVLTLFGILLVLALADIVFAENLTLADLIDYPQQTTEKCYLNLNINEFKSDSTLSLIRQQNVYGFYDTLVNDYSEEMNYNYKIRVYDSSNNIIAQYGSYTSLLTFYDTFDEQNPGGVTVADQGTINSYIYFDPAISRITIEKNGIETDLGINPSNIKCSRTCLIENERGNWLSDKCCSGFFGVETEKESQFICTKCGDGICSRYETWYSCFEDCPKTKETYDEIPDRLFLITEWIFNRLSLNDLILSLEN